jgi:multicomponent Na+:H+ antiporter subunit G
MDLIQNALSWMLLTAGGVFVLVGGIGALRMPNLYTRMHAASVTDTMGAVLVLVGVMLQAGLSLATIKLIAILLFLLITSPTSSYALASAALLAGIRPDAGRAADRPNVSAEEDTSE